LQVLTEEELLRQATQLMDLVVQRPGRLRRSAYNCAVAEEEASNLKGTTPQSGSPALKRRTPLRTNSLRKSFKEVQLRSLKKEDEKLRPNSLIF